MAQPNRSDLYGPAGRHWPCRGSRLQLLLGLLVLWWLGSCAGRVEPGQGKPLPVSYSFEPPHEVRYRPQPPPDEFGEQLVAQIPGATWDAGLACSVQELLMAVTSRSAQLDPKNTALTTARCGFPGQARYMRVLNGGAFPAKQVARITASAKGPIDVAVGSRTYGDGTRFWIVAWARHHAELDPIPRDLPVDEPLPINVQLLETGEARLFVAPPFGAVDELNLTHGVVRWIDRFHTPGSYRIEVVVDRGTYSEVALLFSVFVEDSPPTPRSLRSRLSESPDPVAATEVLYSALNQMRQERGLAPVKRFTLFEPVAREHSALMASAGVVAHSIEGVARGVPVRAAELAHPRAHHYENVAAAATAEEALFLVADSPGHLRNLLCETCTHASIGVALEPVLDRIPRLFVTWELLEFPQGPPVVIDRYNR